MIVYFKRVSQASTMAMLGMSNVSAEEIFTQKIVRMSMPSLPSRITMPGVSQISDHEYMSTIVGLSQERVQAL